MTRKKPPTLPPTGLGPEVETPACLWGKEVRPGKTAAGKREAVLPFPLPAAQLYSFSPAASLQERVAASLSQIPGSPYPTHRFE